MVHYSNLQKKYDTLHISTLLDNSIDIMSRNKYKNRKKCSAELFVKSFQIPKKNSSLKFKYNLKFYRRK